MTIRRKTQTIFTSSARIATTTSGIINMPEDAISSSFVINVTAITSTPSVVFSIQGEDTLSGAFYLLIDSAAITATGATNIHIGPSVATVANLGAGKIIPDRFRVLATHGDADSITYTMSVIHTRDI
ncbi:MAG: hypothetical protein V3R25_09145 [Nitrosomonadaceae bacterium]